MKLINLLFLLFIPVLAFNQVTNELVAQYSFNGGTANDEVGNVNGILSDVLLTEDRFGNPNRALDFQDNVAFVDLGDNFAFFSERDGSFSMSFWIKTGMTGNELVINKYGNSGCNPAEDEREFFVRVNGNQKVEFLYYSTFVAENYRGIEGNMIVTDDCWHHIVINYDGSVDTGDGIDRVEIYIDNVLTTKAFAHKLGFLGDIRNSSSHLGLGLSLDSEGQACTLPYNGKFDDLRFFSRSLSAEEVNLLFEEQQSVSDAKSIADFVLMDDVLCMEECTNFIDNSLDCQIAREWIFENGEPATSTELNPSNICFATAGMQNIP